MTTTQELVRLRKRIDEAKKEHAQAEGAYDQLMKQIRTEFGCKDLASAKRKLAKIEKEIDEMDKQLEKRLKAFKDKYDV